MTRDGDQGALRWPGLVSTGRGAARLGLALLTLLAPAARAQALVEANGIKIGDGRLHPFLNLLGRFDSAAGYFGGNNTLAGELILQVQPGVRFGLESDSTTVNFNGNAEYVWYTGALNRSSVAASRFQTSVGLDTAFNRDGAVEVQLGDQLTRSDRTQNAAVGIGVLSLFNNAYLRFPIHPGGRALEFTPRVDWAVEFFEPLLGGVVPGCATGNITCDPLNLSKMNYSSVIPGLGARWKFLPKTALTFDSSLNIRTYWNPTNGPGSNLNALVFGARVGIAGLITSHFAVTANVGYGGDFSNLGRGGFSSVIAQVDLGWLPREGSAVHLGYSRTAQPVPVYGTFGDDRAYIEARVTVLQRLGITANFAFDNLTFYSPLNATNFSRADQLLTGGAAVEYRFTSWFFAALQYGFSARISSTAATQNINFVRHEPTLRVTFQY